MIKEYMLNFSQYKIKTFAIFYYIITKPEFQSFLHGFIILFLTFNAKKIALVIDLHKKICYTFFRIRMNERVYVSRNGCRIIFLQNLTPLNCEFYNKE